MKKLFSFFCCCYRFALFTTRCDVLSFCKDACDEINNKQCLISSKIIVCFVKTTYKIKTIFFLFFLFIKATDFEYKIKFHDDDETYTRFFKKINKFNETCVISQLLLS
jgi:hypothetical protein